MLLPRFPQIACLIFAFLGTTGPLLAGKKSTHKIQQGTRLIQTAKIEETQKKKTEKIIGYSDIVGLVKNFGTHIDTIDKKNRYIEPVHPSLVLGNFPKLDKCLIQNEVHGICKDFFKHHPMILKIETQLKEEKDNDKIKLLNKERESLQALLLQVRLYLTGGIGEPHNIATEFFKCDQIDVSLELLSIFATHDHGNMLINARSLVFLGIAHKTLGDFYAKKLETCGENDAPDIYQVKKIFGEEQTSKEKNEASKNFHSSEALAFFQVALRFALYAEFLKDNLLTNKDIEINIYKDDKRFTFEILRLINDMKINKVGGAKEFLSFINKAYGIVLSDEKYDIACNFHLYNLKKALMPHDGKIKIIKEYASSHDMLFFINQTLNRLKSEGKSALFQEFATSILGAIDAQSNLIGWERRTAQICHFFLFYVANSEFVPKELKDINDRVAFKKSHESVIISLALNLKQVDFSSASQIEKKFALQFMELYYYLAEEYFQKDLKAHSFFLQLFKEDFETKFVKKKNMVNGDIHEKFNAFYPTLHGTRCEKNSSPTVWLKKAQNILDSIPYDIKKTIEDQLSQMQEDIREMQDGYDILRSLEKKLSYYNNQACRPSDAKSFEHLTDLVNNAIKYITTPSETEGAHLISPSAFRNLHLVNIAIDELMESAKQYQRELLQKDEEEKLLKEQEESLKREEKLNLIKDEEEKKKQREFLNLELDELKKYEQEEKKKLLEKEEEKNFLEKKRLKEEQEEERKLRKRLRTLGKIVAKKGANEVREKALLMLPKYLNEDFKDLQKNNEKVHDMIEELLWAGKTSQGKRELLKEDLSGLRSIRVDLKNRIVYKFKTIEIVDENSSKKSRRALQIFDINGHYDKIDIDKAQKSLELIKNE